MIEPARGDLTRLLGTQDLHVHTNMSDGDLDLAEVVAIATDLGVTVGITDHVSSRNIRRFVSDAERLDRYLAALEAEPVFRSAELCWCDPFSAEIARNIVDRFDYLVGSNHGFALPDGSFASPWWSTLPPEWRTRPEKLMEIMVLNLRDLVTTMPIAIIAHSTLLPPALLALEPDLHAWWTDDLEDTFIEAVLAHGVAIEISNRYQLPHDRLLMKARQAGARFSLGSDGHHRHQVARLDWAVETAVRVGIGDDDLFAPDA
jgi:histidinol phosphatase-like PHP family hydrolase